MGHHKNRITVNVNVTVNWGSPNSWPVPVAGPVPTNWPTPPGSSFDVIYFLDCRNINNQNLWRSAVMRFKTAQLDIMNQGVKPVAKVDEFCWVTSGHRRQYPGFMYDVSFDARMSDAGHFRSMIYPGAEQCAENTLCGWIAKVEHEERSRMMPVYRADNSALMRIGEYDCFRMYYSTWAAPPAGAFQDRANRLQNVLGHYVAPDIALPINTPGFGKFKRMIGLGSGSPHPIDRPDIKDEDVEAPRDIFGGTVEEESDPPKDDAPGPELPNYEVGSTDDPDTFEGEDIKEVTLYEDNEH